MDNTREKLLELEQHDAARAIEVRMLFAETIAHLDDPDPIGDWTARRKMLDDELDEALEETQ